MESVIYSDGWRGYNGLVDVGYSRPGTRGEGHGKDILKAYNKGCPKYKVAGEVCDAEKRRQGSNPSRISEQG